MTFNSTESARFDLQVCCDMLDPWTVPGRAISRSIDAEGDLQLDQVKFASQAGAYPCSGAQHNLWFYPKVGSPLSGLQVALRWINEPPDSFGIIFTPELGVLEPLDSSGKKWLMYCVNSRRIESFSFEFYFPELELYYTPVSMSLGNNRLKVIKERQAAVDPVRANNEAVCVGLKLESVYTREPVRSVPVTFKRPGTTDLVVNTLEDGFAMCDYQPPSDSDVEVTASFLNPYDGETLVTRFAVKTLASNPWPGLEFHFATDQQPQAIGLKTAFPRRGETYTIRLKPDNASNALVGRAVTLGLGGIDAREIRATLTPDWGQTQTMDVGGATWTLQLGDIQDAGFTVFAAASRLSKMSPANPMSLGSVALPASHAADDQFDG